MGGLIPDDISALVINSHNHLFAGSNGEGIFRSSDNGENWQEFNSGLTNLDARALAIDSNGFLFAGTNAGIFRSLHSTTSAKPETGELPASYSLEQNYPNPINSTTTIQYYLPQKSKVSLKIYNMLGKEINSLVNKIQAEGTKSIVWDGKDSYDREVPSGNRRFHRQHRF